jgi:hypothetical protein
MGADMATTRQLIAILFFCVAMRALATTLLSVSDLPISDYAHLISQVFFFLLLSAICAIVIKRNGETLLTQAEIQSPFFNVWNGAAVGWFCSGSRWVNMLSRCSLFPTSISASHIDVGTSPSYREFQIFCRQGLRSTSSLPPCWRLSLKSFFSASC